MDFRLRTILGLLLQPGLLFFLLQTLPSQMQHAPHHAAHTVCVHFVLVNLAQECSITILHLLDAASM
jgi:hypothetical protein